MRHTNEIAYLPPVRWRVPALHESWYSLWSSFCLRQPLAHKEVHALLSGRDNTMMLDPTGVGAANLGSRVPETLMAAFDVTKEMAVLLSGADMDNEPRSSGHMHVGLRYCPACLSNGYHSAVFQHLSIDHCPLHNTPLRTTCEICQIGLNPTWRVAASNAFACPRCDHMFVRGVPHTHRDTEIRLVGLMLGSRREVIVHHCQRTSRIRPCVLPARRPDGALPPAAIKRHVQRQSIWTTGAKDGWLTFTEVVVPIRERRTDAKDLQFSQSVDMAIRKTLLRIRELFKDDAADLKRLQTILGRLEGGRRFTETVSVIACAILKTEYLLGAQIRGGTPPASGPLDPLQASDLRCQPEQRGAALLPFVEANAVLVECEVLGLFCLNVWRISHLRRLADVAWSEFPNPAYFRPEWCLDDRRTPSQLRVRSRANWHTVQFLIKRYAGRLLQ